MAGTDRRLSALCSSAGLASLLLGVWRVGGLLHSLSLLSTGSPGQWFPSLEIALGITLISRCTRPLSALIKIRSSP